MKLVVWRGNFPLYQYQPQGRDAANDPPLLLPITNGGTGADELLTESGLYLLQEDGSYLRLDSGVDVSVDGEILTASPVLVAGVPSRNTSADEILQEDGFLILQEDGYNLVVDAAAGDVSVSGETLSVTVTLLDGTATGTANVTGETLTATPTLTAGTATGTASVTGETLTATPTLLAGTATGTASVTGETLTATPTLLDGTVTGTESVTGETLTVTPTLLDGTVDTAGNVTITGETLVVSVLLLDGDVTIVGAQAPSKPPGGDDAPRSHVGIPPKRVKDKYEKRGVDREDIEEIYNRIQGIEPQTKVAQKAIKAVQKAVAPSAAELPPASTLDWVAIENNLKAAIAIRRAYRIIQDEEDAVIALLLAA